MILNLTKKTCISRAPFYAVTFFSRLRGMIGRDFANANFDAMIFDRCNTIHTFFMSEKIDVIFVDRENAICGLRENLPPWRPCVHSVRACATLELPAGRIAATGTEIGDVIDLRAELSGAMINELKNKELIQPVETVIPLKVKESKK